MQTHNTLHNAIGGVERQSYTLCGGPRNKRKSQCSSDAEHSENTLTRISARHTAE